MFDRIVEFQGMNLIGLNIEMSFAEPKVRELWSKFMPLIKDLKRKNPDLYSLEEYSEDYFNNFNPKQTFIKWALVEDEGGAIENLKTYVLKNGLYAVFIHRGHPKDGINTYNYIFLEWLPNSEYLLDNRPHFAVMGEKYNNNSSESEEEIWIPIRLYSI